MKVIILNDTHYRVSGAVSQSYKAGPKPVNLPKATAEALIKRGDAKAHTAESKGD